MYYGKNTIKKNKRKTVCNTDKEELKKNFKLRLVKYFLFCSLLLFIMQSMLLTEPPFLNLTLGQQSSIFLANSSLLYDANSKLIASEFNVFGSLFLINRCLICDGRKVQNTVIRQNVCTQIP